MSYWSCGEQNPAGEKYVYVVSNGVHLDIVMPGGLMGQSFYQSLELTESEWLSFGWGEKNFYLNTPTWGDLTFKNLCKAMFINTPTVMHVSPIRNIEKHLSWYDHAKVRLDEKQFEELQAYIQTSFLLKNGRPERIRGFSYNGQDAFYEAIGSYNALTTCNVWVNSALKKIGAPSAVWTPFDFAVLYHLNPKSSIKKSRQSGLDRFCLFLVF